MKTDDVFITSLGFDKWVEEQMMKLRPGMGWSLPDISKRAFLAGAAAEREHIKAILVAEIDEELEKRMVNGYLSGKHMADDTLSVMVGNAIIRQCLVAIDAAGQARKDGE